MEKQILIYRVNRQDEEDAVWCSEDSVRYALSAWVKNVEKSIARLKRGQKVFTPHAYYVTREV